MKFLSYQHRDNVAVEMMVGEALRLVEDSFFVVGRNGNRYKLWEAIFDMEAYKVVISQENINT